MFSRIKEKRNEAKKMVLRSLCFVSGAVPYQGADDVTYILYALIIAIRACEKSKNLNVYERFLLLEWRRLLLKNKKFMEDMEVENHDIF